MKKISKSKTILILGNTGAGKSSLINFFQKIGNKITNSVPIVGNRDSTTKDVSSYEIQMNNKAPINLMDTRGFNDTKDFTDGEIANNILSYLIKNKKCHKGFDGIIFVINPLMKRYYKKQFEYLETLFTKSVYFHLIIVFTHYDYVETLPKSNKIRRDYDRFVNEILVFIKSKQRSQMKTSSLSYLCIDNYSYEVPSSASFAQQRLQLENALEALPEWNEVNKITEKVMLVQLLSIPGTFEKYMRKTLQLKPHEIEKIIIPEQAIIRPQPWWKKTIGVVAGVASLPFYAVGPEGWIPASFLASASAELIIGKKVYPKTTQKFEFTYQNNISCISVLEGENMMVDLKKLTPNKFEFTGVACKDPSKFKLKVITNQPIPRDEAAKEFIRYYEKEKGKILEIILNAKK